MLALAAGLAGASAGAGEGAERDPQVRVATTGNRSERVKTLPITRRPGAERRVVMSRTTASSDLIKGDLGVTTECYRLLPRCRRSPYRYDPRVRAQLF